MTVEIVVMKAVNEDNARLADEVRQVLNRHNVLGLNLMSSPGSGKTALLEATFKQLDRHWRSAVVEGDVFTSLDAERVAACGVPARQINTEGSCHMTAHMLQAILPELPLDQSDLLFIENIGNLICPASFDLGEHKRVACLSTPEGADKIIKYPRLFSISQVNLITKADLAQHVDFDIPHAIRELQWLNPEAAVFVTSAKTGEGIEAWCNWLAQAYCDVFPSQPAGGE